MQSQVSHTCRCKWQPTWDLSHRDYGCVSRFQWWQSAPDGQLALAGQATTLIAVIFLGGVQLITLGILGEYIGRIYDEAHGRPLYIVRDAPVDEIEETLPEDPVIPDKV